MYKTTNVRVLVVEDDFLVSEMIDGALSDMGHQVVGKATDGKQALELVQSLRPDLILMDIEMPGMNGIEASRQITESHPTPIVVLTAYDTPDLVKQASEAGVGAYLIKPPNAQDMDRAILIAMARFEDMQALRRLNLELQTRNKALEQALIEVKQLSGLLPICASCKQIRDDEGDWHQIEAYIKEHSEAEFSHGLCPDCLRRLYPDYYQDVIDEQGY